MEHDEDVQHCRPVRRVLLHAEEAEVDALEHLVLRGLAVQRLIHGLQRRSLGPVIPYLARNNMTGYILIY